MNSRYKQWKSDYRKKLNKKQKVLSENFEKKKPKATKKPKVDSSLSSMLNEVLLLIANTTNTATNCTCPTDYTSFVMDTNIKCFKFGTKGPLSSAVSTCAKDGARPPLPTNAKENADLLAFFLSKRNASEHEFALDLSDFKTEGLFISSIGHSVNYTNWWNQKPGNKTDDTDFVIMNQDGLWNVTDGNYSSSIICQIDCSSESNTPTEGNFN